ncbi:MAG: hypothetical protein SOI66_08975 [Bifidobacterium sp.]|jgi:hypothetical protein
MSVQATSWALREAPVGGDVTSRLILLILADYAKPDGTGAYPSVHTVALLARVSDRCVRKHLSDLHASGVIRRGDQRILSHIRADRRTTVWDLCMAPAGESGMSVVQERAIAVGLDGVNDGAPRAGGSEDSSGVNAGSGRDADGVNQRAGRSMPRGERGGIHGVNGGSPKPLDKPINTPMAPTGPSTDIESRNPRRALPAEWSPNVPAKIYAAEHGIDLPSASGKFRLWAMSDGRRLRDWDSRFLLWLHNEKPIQPAGPEQPHAIHTHTWQCRHVNRLLRRESDETQPDELACTLARKLNNGASDAQALSELGLTDEWEAA